MAAKTFTFRFDVSIIFPSACIAFFVFLISCGRPDGGPPSRAGRGKKAIPESAGYDWPRWRGPDGNGVSRETGWDPKAPEKGPKILWRTNVGFGYSNVAIEGGRLYTMGRKREKKDVNNYVYCFNANTGKRLWRVPFKGSEIPQSTPTVEGGFVYALGQDGNLFCLSAKNGKYKWIKDIVGEFRVVRPHYGFAGSPVIEGELIVLTANTAGMALDKKTGEKVWCSESPPKEIRYSDSTGVEYQTPVLYSREGK